MNRKSASEKFQGDWLPGQALEFAFERDVAEVHEASQAAAWRDDERENRLGVLGRPGCSPLCQPQMMQLHRSSRLSTGRTFYWE